MRIGLYIGQELAPKYHISAIELAYRLGGPFEDEIELCEEWLDSEADNEFIIDVMSVLPGRGSYGERLDSGDCEYIERELIELVSHGETFRDFADLVKRVAVRKLTDDGMSEDDVYDEVMYESKHFMKDSNIFKAASNVAAKFGYECVVPSYIPYDDSEITS